MKTTLWNREEVTRARPLLQGMERDLAGTLARADAAIAAVRDRKGAFERVKPKHAAPYWIDLVRAQDELNDALADLQHLAAEVHALNGRLALDRGAAIDLAGTDDGVPVYWSLAGDAPHAEAVFAREPVAA